MAQVEPAEPGASVAVADQALPHKPYVSSQSTLPEFTVRAVLLGVFFGLVFGAATVYLGLKVGLTVSASIPIAVLAITVLRLFGRATILENNIVQTTGSAGESIAAGIVFTIPALLILGLDLDVLRTTLIGLTGGVLGVLLMIPLRRALIVKEHGNLPYPEGTACAEVLVVGEKGGTDAKTVFLGFGVGIVYKFLMSGLKFWKEIPDRVLTWYQGAQVAASISPELLGVGYIIGPRIASYMFGGGIIAALVLTPIIKFFGAGLQTNIFPAQPGQLIGNMNAGQVFDNYVRYIAAGAVATGGIISLLRSLPTIIGAFQSGVKDFRGNGKRTTTLARIERDVPILYAAAGVVGLLVIATLLPHFGVDPVSAVLILVFGLFFVTVSSRICGQIGSTSNPISGMTIATLLFTSLIFLLLGRSGAGERVIALTVGAIVCVAAANAGNTSQDLKTGFLVGATPGKQQVALMIGAVTSAIVIGWTLLFLNNSAVNILPRDYPSYSAPTNLIGEQWTTESEIEDGKRYRVLRLAVETETGDGTTKVPPGKYLVDDQGKIHYFVNPGVGGISEKLTANTIPDVRSQTFTEGPNVRAIGKGRGLDDNMYDKVSVTGLGNKPRTFLIDEAGTPHYEQIEAEKLPAPKAALMGILVDGVLTRKLPWSLILIGAFISILLEIIGVSALPVAVGIYLPISTSATIFAGGMIREVINRMTRRGREETLVEEETGRGVLLSSGLIAGGALGGLAVALGRVAVERVNNSPGRGEELLGIGGRTWVTSGDWANVIALIIFAGLAAFLFTIARKRSG